MPGILDGIRDRMPVFLDKALKDNPMKGEFLLPTMMEQMIREDFASVKVLSCGERWFGVTYAEDKPIVMAALKELTEMGKYPDGLWK